MNNFSSISRATFEQSLDHQKILPIQIVYGALSLGILLFVFVILFLAGHSQGQQPEETDLLILLSGVHGLMTLTVYAVAPIIFRRILNAPITTDQQSEQPSVSTILKRISTAYIVRIAMYEGVALFGLVICLLTIVMGFYPTQPGFLFNGLSVVLFLSAVTLTFPTTDRLGNLFSQYFS